MKKQLNLSLLGTCLIIGFNWASPVVAQVTLDVINPRAEIPPRPSVGGLAPRLPDLAGKRIGLIANVKPGAELFLTKIEELLKAKFPTVTIVRLRMTKIGSEQAKTLASKIDTFIHSTGD